MSVTATNESELKELVNRLLAEVNELKELVAEQEKRRQRAAGEETRGQETADQKMTRLRKAILENLHRRGPTLLPELAAATLSLPDEIRPVLQAMEEEGLVEIQTTRGWAVVSLTTRGRDAIRNP